MDKFHSVYDGYRPPKNQSIGGKARAKSAKRDRWGRFLPLNGELKPPSNHGVIGGMVRAEQAKRDKKGRYIK